MTLYEINNEILGCIDEETGEIFDFEKLETLSLEKNIKVENICLLIKEWAATAEAIKNEIKILRERKTSLENECENLKGYLYGALGGEGFETAKCKVSFKKSSAVEVDDDFINWAIQNDMDCYLRYKTPEVNKSMISEAIKSGKNVPHAEMVQRLNINIK